MRADVCAAVQTHLLYTTGGARVASCGQCSNIVCVFSSIIAHEAPKKANELKQGCPYTVGIQFGR